MSDTVFVNNLSVVHAGSPGKSTAFPDVNLCPPAPPAGPVPVPLPNVAQAADLAGGAETVTVGGNPVGKKSSYLARSTGNAVARSTGGGVVTHVVEGQARFVSHSMTVMIEGEPVPRHLDLMTHNHAAMPGEAVGCYLGSPAVADGGTGKPLAPEPIEHAKKQPITYEFCVDARAWKTSPGKYRLRSEDGRYNQLAVELGSKGADLIRLGFKNVLPALFYTLALEKGDQVFSVFEGVPFARLQEHQETAPRPEVAIQSVPDGRDLPPLPEPITQEPDWWSDDPLVTEKKP